MNEAMLSRIEHRRRASPHFVTVAKLAAVLDVSLDALAAALRSNEIDVGNSSRRNPVVSEERRTQALRLIREAEAILAKIEE